MLSLLQVLEAARLKQWYDANLGWIVGRDGRDVDEEFHRLSPYLISLVLELSNRIILLEQQASQYAELWDFADGVRRQAEGARAVVDKLAERVAALEKTAANKTSAGKKSAKRAAKTRRKAA